MDEWIIQDVIEGGFEVGEKRAKEAPWLSELGWAEEQTKQGRSYAMNPVGTKGSPLSALGDDYLADAKRFVKDPLDVLFPTISNDNTGTRSFGNGVREVDARTIKPPPGFSEYGKSSSGFFGFGARNEERDSVKVLTRAEDLGLLSLVSDSNLLSKAEESGLFTTLESSGALSTAEKALPVVENLGLLSVLQSLIDEEPLGLVILGTLLAGLGPLYATLDIAGVVPDQGAIGVLGGLTTTAAGVALLALANAITLLQSERSTTGTKNVKLLSQLEKLGLLSLVAEKGLLSKAEEAGVLSSLESAGAFSAAEKALPTIENLGLLSLAQSLIDNDPKALSTAGTALALAAPLYAALDAAGQVPDPGALGVLGGVTTTAAGVALLALGSAINFLQSDE
jgi:hypothetical protein